MELSLNEKKKLKNIFDNIEGMLTEEDMEFLYNRARDCESRKGVIVEIGAWKGRSTICLGKGSKTGNQVKIYSIDPHKSTSLHKVTNCLDTYAEFLKNIQIAEVDDVILPIVKTSQEAAETFNEPIQFLFIDGEHDYENVKLDLQLWYPKLIYGGLIAFHDYGLSGPRRIIERYIYNSKHFKNVNFVGFICFAKKVKRNSLRDRLRNMILFFLDKCAFLYHRIPIRKPIIKLRMKVRTIIK